MILRRNSTINHWYEHSKADGRHGRRLITMTAAASLFLLGQGSLASAGAHVSVSAHTRSISTYLVGDPFADGSPIPESVLGTYTSQVTAGLKGLMRANERVSTTYDAWTATDANGEEIGMVGLAAFSGAIPAHLATSLIAQACTQLGGDAPTSTSPINGIAWSKRADCTDGFGDSVTIDTWAKANVQAIVVLDGVDAGDSVAAVIAKAQNAKLPLDGVGTSSVAQWRIAGSTATLTKSQKVAVSQIAMKMASLRIDSVKFVATLRAASAGARSAARLRIATVSRYLSEMLKVDGVSTVSLSSLIPSPPTNVAFVTSLSPSVTVIIRYEN